jgi:flagellar basal body-associated protein FliL
MKKYFYTKGKEKYGPFTIEELSDKGLNNETLVWAEGMENWHKLQDIPELARVLSKYIPPSLPHEIKKTERKEAKQGEKILWTILLWVIGLIVITLIKGVLDIAGGIPFPVHTVGFICLTLFTGMIWRNTDDTSKNSEIKDLSTAEQPDSNKQIDISKNNEIKDLPTEEQSDTNKQIGKNSIKKVLLTIFLILAAVIGFYAGYMSFL